MRGAHSGVWCSKGQRLMEAELFAAERRRPAPNGRALSCAANHARKIQGLTASQNLPDARNRAPVPPFRRAPEGSRGAKEGLGESRGGKGTIRCPCPLLSPPPDGGIPGRRRRPMTTPSEGVKSPPAAHRCIVGKVCRLLQIKQKGHSSPAAAGRRNGGRFPVC